MLASSAVPAQVRRCTATDGTVIYTDRRCQDIGASERVPRGEGSGVVGLYRNVCARNLMELGYELASAIDAGDVNRLAAVYYWVGLSTRTGYDVMRRLDAIAARPLVDVVPLYPVSADAQDDDSPQATVRRAPIGLRLEQTLANGSTPSRTLFGLRHYYGCWWVQL